LAEKSRRNHSAVEKLRQQFGLPGMSLLQFAFGMILRVHRSSHNYNRDLVAYTGDTDNDTTVRLVVEFRRSDSTRTPEDVRKERELRVPI